MPAVNLLLLPPAAAESYAYGGAPPTYSSTYGFVQQNAWQGATTFYCEPEGVELEMKCDGRCLSQGRQCAVLPAVPAAEQPLRMHSTLPRRPALLLHLRPHPRAARRQQLQGGKMLTLLHRLVGRRSAQPACASEACC